MKTKILSILALLLMTVTQGAWAQETLTVYDGTGTSQYIPMYGYSFDYYTKSECIIPASELTAMEGGTITAITFYAQSLEGSNPTFGTANQKVFLKEVSETTLSSYSGMDDATVVYDGTLPMPTTSASGYTITFSQGYTYNGGNLLIGIYNAAKGSWRKVFWYGIDNQSSGVSAFGYSGNSLASVSFKAQQFLPKTTFTYNPAPTAVDLGLPSGKKWADMNVGAGSATGIGTYFEWGETTAYDNNNSYSGNNPTTLPLSNDAAYANWGSNWRMPTKAEYDELLNETYTTWTWFEDYNSTGVGGYLVTSKMNGNSIFLPKTGYMKDGYLNAPARCDYWSSTINGSNNNEAYALGVGSGDRGTASFSRSFGFAIRPVQMFAGEGTEASPYLIASTTDWDNLSAAVNAGTEYSGIYFKLTANISVTTMIGASDKPFRGSFDGGGHTLTVNYTASAAGTAPFPRTASTTLIKNLHVAGTITSGDFKVAGLVSEPVGATIEHCRVSATISANAYHGLWIGGFCNGGNVTINNCLFDGKINCVGGGFIGYSETTSHITNCLFAPQTGSSLGSSQDGNGVFIYTKGRESNLGTVTNSYYTSLAGGVAQGTDGSGMTAAQLVQNLGPSNWKVVGGNAIPKVHPNLSGLGTEASPYLIASTTDWNNLVSAVNAGETYSGNYFKMTANVGTVSTWMTGTFSGTFDGYGNTLTVGYSNTTADVKCAPFGTLNGATIQNLKVAGSISSNQRFIAGIAAWCSSTGNNVTNCLVSATINSGFSGNAADGGLVSLVDDGASLNVTGCAFAGKMLTTNGTTSCGGIVGWRRSSGTVTITNCLYAPTSATGSETWIESAEGENGNANFCRWNSSEPTITNCYYTTDFGSGSYTAQGIQARTIAKGDYVSTLSVTKGDGTEYDVSGITVYSGGIDFNDGSTTTFYGGSGQSVSLALTAETRSGYHFKQYAASQGTLSDETTDTPTLTMPAANSTANDVVTILAEYDPFSGGTGTSVNPYQIASTADWNLLVSNVNAGETYSGNYFKMTANVGTVSTWMTGDMTTTGIFSGHFDGDGHTLTVNYSSDTQYCHPFGFLRGATIENLHVTGNITTSQTYAAGLAGRALSNSTNYITNCLVSTNITSTRSGTANICGVVMSVQANATLYIEGCAFTGSITSSNGTDNGGFSEWVTAGGTFSATNCLFAPSSVTDENLANSATFCRNGGTFSGCYYTRTLGTAQGTKAYSITGGNYVTVANAGAATATVYNVSGITSYGTGIQYGGVLYGGNGDAVSLTLTAPEHDGYGFVYSADNGTVTGNDNPYTLTMVDANAIINVKYSASKAINKYTSDDTSDGWYLIASPIGIVSPDSVTHMTDNTYDIYRFNQNPTPTMVDEVSQYLEWENWKQANPGETEPRHFNLEPGRGYLYANSDNVTLTFIGTPYEGDGIVPLVRSNSNGNDKTNMLGWNLIGNPFGVTAYIDRDFYRMNYGEGNTGGNEIIPATNTSSPIAPMEGIFVYAEEEGSSVTFSTQAPSKGHSQKPESEQVVLNLSRDRGSVIDRAIVRMGEGQALPKFQIRENSTKLYIPQGAKDYAIATSDGQGEMPLNFKANANGEYTLTVNPENVEMNYLHLIDNMTGADIDLLATTEYTFTAKTTDYESRFKLVFVCGDANDDNDDETFAFFSNGNWIIANEGQATLQVIDITGRILSSETVNGSVSKAINAVPGVYMLRLINGDNVKVQKIVVR